MPNQYTEAEMSRCYRPAERMLFSIGGRIVMTPERADQLACNLVERDRETGEYRRIHCDQELERTIIDAALARTAQLKLAPKLGNRLR